MNARDDLSEDPRAPDSDADPVLPEVARDDADDADHGWGDDPCESRRDADWYQRERPPHHE